MRAILVFLVSIGVISVALVLAWPHCLGLAGCSSGISRNRWWLGGMLGGGAIVASVALWSLHRREGLRGPED